MSRIDLHNYEAFLLDHLEGRLNARDLELLKAFAKAHPELEIDLEDTDLPFISKEPVEMDFKSTLLKTGPDLQDEELLDYLENNLSAAQRSAFEAKLSGDAGLAKDLELYKKTILRPDPVDHDLKAALLKTEEDLAINNRIIAYVEKTLSAEEKLELEAELKADPKLQQELSLVLNTVLTEDLSIVYPDKNALKKKSRVIAIFNYRTFSAAAAILLLLGFGIVFGYYQSEGTQRQGTIANTAPVKQGTENKVSKPEERSVPSGILQAADENIKPGERQIAKRGESQNDTEKKNEAVVPEIQEPLIAEQQNSSEPSPIAQPKNEEAGTEKQLAEAKTENTLDSISKYSNLIAVEEISEDEELNSKGNAPKGWWRRAVQVAKQANKLGVKSIDGEEDAGNRYRLSFNSFSVEKK